MFNILFLIILNTSSFFNEIKNSSWVRNINGINEVRIYSDKFFVVSKYDATNKTFISTKGGKYSLDNGYYEVMEFNSSDTSSVGDTLYYSNVKINIKNDSGKMIIDGIKYLGT